MILFCDIKPSKKITISEDKIDLLKESLSNIVYHFTSLHAVFNMLMYNEIFCQSAKCGGAADNMNNKYDFYISTTRTRSSQEGFGYGRSKGLSVRIEFDGDKLNQNFHGEAVNYWGGDDTFHNKFSYMRRVQNNKHFQFKEITDPNEIEKHDFADLPPFNHIFSNGESYATEDAPDFVEYKGRYYKKVQAINPELQHHRDNEIEDRLFTNKPIINDFRKYVRRIDVLAEKDFEKSETVMSLLVQLSVRFSNIVFIYDNVKDFDMQNNNILNKEYQELYSKYGELIPFRKNNIDLRFLKNICSLEAYFVETSKEKEFISLLLRKYGLERYTREVLKSYERNYGLRNLIDNLDCDTQNASKQPSRENQIVLKMFSDFLRKNGYTSLRDAYAKMKKEEEIKYSHNAYDWNSIDTQTNKVMKILEVNGYRKFIINNDEDTDFWYIFSMERKVEKYGFIDNVIYDLEGGRYGDNYKSVIRDGNIYTFKRYLQNLAYKKVTLNQMFGLFEKLGIDPKELMSYEGYPFEIYENNGNYWNYSYSHYHAPFETEDDELYVRELFKKTTAN